MVYWSSMGKVCTKHILGLLWKMVDNVLFLDSEHVVMGICSHPKKLVVVYVICLVSKNYFTRLFFVVGAIIRYAAKVYK